eukprot:2673317-Rhodomonas_salina.3
MTLPRCHGQRATTLAPREHYSAVIRPQSHGYTAADLPGLWSRYPASSGQIRSAAAQIGGAQPQTTIGRA